MESNTTTCESCDILSSRRRVFFLYWLPAIAIVVARRLSPSPVRFFLLMALVALSYGPGSVRRRGNGWNRLGVITLIGAIALRYLPEMFLGKNRKGREEMATLTESCLSLAAVAKRPDRIFGILRPRLPAAWVQTGSMDS